ncbi:MAG: hypothetical protein GY847_04070 [Proteobacteria bacterium]|nr:hypothetical protein [Pseudomonadota bacterium]
MTQGLTMPLGVIVTVFLLAAACSNGSKPTPYSSGPDPLATVRELLRLHDLLGKQPEDRSEETRNKEVERGALSPLFLDLDAQEPFLTNLYVGFVVGVLARNQGRLYISRRGHRVEVTAGNARIVLKLESDRFRIVLKESIPEAIKKRAAKEKARFEEAKRISVTK